LINAVVDFVGSYLGNEHVWHYFKVTVSHPDPVSKTTSEGICWLPKSMRPVYDTCLLLSRSTII